MDMCVVRSNKSNGECRSQVIMLSFRQIQSWFVRVYLGCVRASYKSGVTCNLH